MNLSKFENQELIDNNIQSYSKVEEAKRLADELRSQPPKTTITMSGKRINIPAKEGFDCETCDFNTLCNWLRNTKEKSQSLIAFVHRVLSIRFPNEYAQKKNYIDMRYRTEFELIGSNATNDITWLGETGFQNCVRLDSSLSNHTLKVIKRKNDNIKIKII